MSLCRQMLMIAGLCVVASVAWAGIGDGLTEGLISAWTFDDGTANDIKGRNNGILRGDASIVEGKTGFGVRVDGPESFVEIPHGPSMDGMRHSFTHAAWAFVEKSGDHAGIMFKGELIGHGPKFHIRLATISATNLTYGSCTESGTRGEIDPGIQARGGGEVWINSFNVYNEGEWIHIAQTANGSHIQTYLNGVSVSVDDGAFEELKGTDPHPLLAPYAVFPDYPLILGMALKPTGATSIDGIIDEAAIFNRALSDIEIAQLGDFDWATAVRAEGKLATTWSTIKNGAGL